MLSDSNQNATSNENMCMMIRETNKILAWKTYKSQKISSLRYSGYPVLESIKNSD